MSGNYGIKETLDVIDAIEGLTIDTIESLKDGASLDDITVLFKNLEPLKEALKGIDQIDDEMKDLDIEEIKMLTGKAVEMVFAIVAKVKELGEAKKVIAGVE